MLPQSSWQALNLPTVRNRAGERIMAGFPSAGKPVAAGWPNSDRPRRLAKSGPGEEAGTASNQMP